MNALCGCDGFSEKGSGDFTRDGFGWWQPKWKREWILTLDERHIVLTPGSESFTSRSCLQGCVWVEEIRDLDRFIRLLLTVIPQEQVHVEDDFTIGVVHGCSRQKDQDQSIGGLYKILQSTRDAFHAFIVRGFTDVVSFVDNQQSIVKVCMHPFTINVLFRASEFGHDECAERTIGNELVELLDDEGRGAFEFRTDFRIVPVLGFRFNPHQHVEISPTCALLGLQGSGNCVDIDSTHIEQLGLEVVLNRSRGYNHHLLVLELGTQDVFFRHLNRTARFTCACAVNHQQVTIRTVGG